MSNPQLIAIVDDDEAVREALLELLQVEGLAARTFERAERFYAAYAPGVFACLVTDIRMPGMSGLDLLRRLRAAGAELPVIIVSSVADPATSARALEDGAQAFLPKPVEAEALVREVIAVLRRSRGDG